MVDGVNQQPGLFQRIGNFFGGDDPNAGQPTDPFAGLSRPQRTMLGFAALRDAAASLEGRDSNFFQSALGGFEQARDRERLRAQGEMQNRVGALQALATLNEQMRYNQAFGLPIDPATEALRQALMTSAGLGSGAAPMAGGAPTSVAPAQGGTRLPYEEVFDPTTGATAPYTGEPEVAQPAPSPVTTAPPATERERLLAEIADATQKMTPRVAAGAGVADLQEQIDQRTARIAEIDAAAAAAAEVAAQQERESETSVRMAPLVNNALSFLTDESGNIRSATSLIASQSGFAAGLLPGVSAADARLARSAIQELAAIAGMSGVSEARANGFGGSLSDADILMIQRSQGIFDLTQPEATVQTLRRLQSQMSQNNGGGQNGELVTLPDGTQVRIRVRG